MRNVLISMLVGIAVANLTLVAPGPFDIDSLPDPGLLSPEELAEDLGVFRTALEEAHPGIYRYTPKSEFDALFAQIASELDRPMSEQAFYQALNPAIVALRCGHTKFHPERNFTTPYYYGLDEQFPLVLFVTGERAWIRADLSPTPTIPQGSEVLEIDGRPIKEIIDQLRTRLSFADGTALASKYLELSTYWSAYYATFMGSAPRYVIAYRAPSTSEVQTKSVSAIPHTRLIAWQEDQLPPQAPLEWTFLDDSVALLTIRSFWFESKAVRFEQSLRDAFAEIREKGAQYLIIDLRDNEGGKDAFGALLYAYLTDKPFRYYDKIVVAQRKPYSLGKHVKLPFYFGLYRLLISKEADGSYTWRHHSNLREQKPMPGAFLGPVYVLINGRSFSVTSEFAAVAKATDRAIFVGQETGGGYRGNNSGFFAIVTLPNSRLVVGIPLWGYYTAVPNPQSSDGGVRPDYAVERTIEDVLNGEDPELDRALQLIVAARGANR